MGSNVLQYFAKAIGSNHRIGAVAGKHLHLARAFAGTTSSPLERRYAPSTPALRTVCRRLWRSDALYLLYRVPHMLRCCQLDF